MFNKLFSVCWLLSLLLTSLLIAQADSSAHPAPVVEATPLRIVQEFLDAKASGRAAPELISSDAITPDSSIAAAVRALNELSTAPPALHAATALLSDPRGKLGYQFTALDEDPDFPGLVRVRAHPVGGGADIPLEVVTTPDPLANSAPRIDPVLTLTLAEPRLMLIMVRKARDKARQEVSANNLKQLSLAALLYAQDHDELYPNAARWVDELMPYLKEDKKVFRDPMAPLDQQWCYAFNRTLSHKSLVLLGQPASTVLFFETTSKIKNTSDTGQSVPLPGRYGNGTDYAFADGHVKWFPDGTKLSYRLDGK